MKTNSISKIYINSMFYMLILILIYSISSFTTRFDQPSATAMSWLAVVVSVVSICYIYSATSHIYGHSLAFLLYLIFTQFGTCFVIYAIPLTSLYSRGYYNTDWVRADSYPRAVQLGIMAVIVFVLIVVRKGNCLAKRNIIQRCQNIEKPSNTNYRPIALVGLIMVGGIALFLSYLLAIGSINISGSYSDFLNYSQSNVSIWSTAMCLLPTGFAFAFTMGNRNDLKILYVLYFFVSIILLFTGNKGEVLYALLAAFGIYCYKKNEINKKVVIIGLLILFIIIPSVTAYRSTSVYGMLSKFFVSVSEPFVEMGYQIRLSVFMIDGVTNGFRNYLWGFSYINPIINIVNRLLPFIPRLATPLQYDFLTTYDTMGFSQVAESYANFGCIGVLVFFMIMGLVLAKFDNISQDDPKQSLYAGWLIIFINMTRNVFSFVFGQMIVVYIIWIIARILCKIFKKNIGDRDAKNITHIRKDGSCWS